MTEYVIVRINGTNMLMLSGNVKLLCQLLPCDGQSAEVSLKVITRGRLTRTSPYASNTSAGMCKVFVGDDGKNYVVFPDTSVSVTDLSFNPESLV